MKFPYVRYGACDLPIIPVTLSISRDMPDNTVNILGQQGFFEMFPIKCTHSKKEIDIMMR